MVRIVREHTRAAGSVTVALDARCDLNEHLTLDLRALPATLVLRTTLENSACGRCRETVDEDERMR
jgi:hypothetical protein